MSRVADGATTRRERILEMLQYIQTFQPKGTSISNVMGHMALAHGLTSRKTEEYIYEMQRYGIIFFEGGKVKTKADQFKRYLELIGREHLLDQGSEE